MESYSWSLVTSNVGRPEWDGVVIRGFLLRTMTLERLAAEAGFASVEVLPVDHDAFRFYRLYP
jgi:hypothetical protein